MHLRTTFSTRRALERRRLNREASDWVLGEVETKFNQSTVHPGETCGTLSARSIGEPGMQTTLNTFHYAGVSSKNVTLGVPRHKEIINVVTNLKTPSLSVYLQPEIAKDLVLGKNVQQELAYTTLSTVTAMAEICYNPDPSSTITKEDNIFVESVFTSIHFGTTLAPSYKSSFVTPTHPVPLPLLTTPPYARNRLYHTLESDDPDHVVAAQFITGPPNLTLAKDKTESSYNQPVLVRSPNIHCDGLPPSKSPLSPPPIHSLTFRHTEPLSSAQPGRFSWYSLRWTTAFRIAIIATCRSPLCRPARPIDPDPRYFPLVQLCLLNDDQPLPNPTCKLTCEVPPPVRNASRLLFNAFPPPIQC